VAAGVFALVHAVGGASAAPLSGCEVTANPPLNDRAFNQAVYDGLTDASTKWGVLVRDEVSSNRSQWHRNVADLIKQRCGLIVTIGTVVASDTVAEAKTNPGQRFASTDAADVRGSANLMSIQFKPDQAAFLAGYLAAGLTKTGKVGTFGGLKIATVTPFMDGFWAGVQHYNEVHGTHVRVLGWNPKTQNGLFVSNDPTDFGAFGRTGVASGLTESLVGAGADVVFPVDGPGGETGSCDAAQRTSGMLLIGVDTDQHYATPDCESRWVTSVMKLYRRMVYLAMGQIYHRSFKGGMLWGTLQNGGVGLAPFYGLTRRIPLRLQRELEQVKQDVVRRSVSVDPKSYSG